MVDAITVIVIFGLLFWLLDSTDILTPLKRREGNSGYFRL